MEDDCKEKISQGIYTNIIGVELEVVHYGGDIIKHRRLGMI